jgi:hypothetical protein
LVLIFLFAKPNGVLGKGPPIRKADDDDDLAAINTAEGR